MSKALEMWCMRPLLSVTVANLPTNLVSEKIDQETYDAAKIEHSSITFQNS